MPFYPASNLLSEEAVFPMLSQTVTTYILPYDKTEEGIPFQTDKDALFCFMSIYLAVLYCSSFFFKA